MTDGVASLASIAALGAMHGINPAMGWLFAVSLGLQARSGHAVVRALGPLALGHALAILSAISVAAVLELVVPLHVLRWIVATMLLACGVLHLTRHRHPRGGGMVVGRRELTIWSYMVASAHGAGLMVVPLVLGGGHSAATPRLVYAGDAHHADVVGVDASGVLAALIHSASYLVVAGLIAWLIYRKLGIGLLRRAWFNVNLIWAVALIATAVVTVL